MPKTRALSMGSTPADALRFEVPPPHGVCLPLNILRLVLGSSLKFHFARPGCGRLRPALAGATMRHQLAGVVTQAFRSCIASAIPGCFWSRVKARMSESGQMTRANHHQHWTPGARVCSYKLLRAWTPCKEALYLSRA